MENPHNSSNSNSETPDRRRTPVEAIVDFDGEIHAVRAHKLHLRWVTKPCLTFCVHSMVLAGVMTFGIVMMMLTDYSSPLFNVWYGLFTLGVGGFLPNPQWKKEKAVTPTQPASVPRVV